MKNRLISCAVAALLSTLLSACGGGGGSSGSGDGTLSSTPANRLAGYVGTWSSACANHAIESATIASPSSNMITITTRVDYYTGADCSGAILATETEGADVTAVYVDTVDSSIVLAPGAAATPAKVDRVTASLPQHARSITGTGVSHTISSGRAQWCIDFGGGNQTCILDEGTYPAQSGVAGALSLQGNAFYELSPNGSLWEVNARFVKK